LRVTKEGKNAFQGFDYFKPDDIMKAINPLLAKYNLIAVFNMPYSKEIEMYKGELIIQDVDSSQNQPYFFDIPLTNVKGAGAAQNAGATQTYCKRYMIMNAFNIADDESDPDSKKAKPKVEEVATMDHIQTLKKHLFKCGAKNEVEALKLIQKSGIKVTSFADMTQRQAQVVLNQLLSK
jgi:hypothetical protein